MITGIEALERLQAGNKRFMASELKRRAVNEVERSKMSAQQSPYAVILGCSDSRVPVETVFDQGIGDVFVIRVAGNIAAPSQVGSIEYAVQQFGTPLVVVLGHSQCGAVTACVETVQQGNSAPTPNLHSIVERIRPAVHTLVEMPLNDNQDELIHHAVRANIRASVTNLRYSSAMLEEYISSDRLLVVGAECDLASGEVVFFEGLPTTGEMTPSGE